MGAKTTDPIGTGQTPTTANTNTAAFAAGSTIPEASRIRLTDLNLAQTF
jgi:hypothetical protein